MEILSVIAIVISIIAISRTNDASLKIAKLEKKLEEGNVSTLRVSDTISETSLTPAHTTTVAQEKVKPNATLTEKKKDEESGFVAWFKEDWLLKLGGILVLMGVLFFLSLGFAAVGNVGKIVMGLLFGVILMAFGFWYAKKQIVGGSTIHVVGAVIILTTTYIARQPDFNIFDPYFATLLMFLTTVSVALTAYAYERSQLAHVGLFLAAIVPMLTNTESNNFAQLLLYLGIVTLGTLWLALVTRWRTLVLLALSIVCVYSVMKLGGGMGSTTISFTESYLIVVFGVLFYVTSLFSILRSQGVTQAADGGVALLNAGFALMWIITQVTHEVAPIVIALIAFVYAAGFFFVYKVTDVYTSFTVYGSVSLGLLTTAIMLQLSGRSETVALLFIGAGATLLTHYLSNNEKITKVVALFNILPLIYVLNSVAMISYARYSSQGQDNAWKDILIVLVAIAVYYGLSRYFVSKIRDLWKVSLFATFALSVIAIWHIVHLTIGGGFATFISILVYTVFGLFILFQGVQEKGDTKIRLAKVWLGLVAARVIFWDAWQVGDVVLGVLICIVIGILLLSSTFILKKVTKE